MRGHDQILVEGIIFQVELVKNIFYLIQQLAAGVLLGMEQLGGWTASVQQDVGVDNDADAVGNVVGLLEKQPDAGGVHRAAGDAPVNAVMVLPEGFQRSDIGQGINTLLDLRVCQFQRIQLDGVDAGLNLFNLHGCTSGLFDSWCSDCS